MKSSLDAIPQRPVAEAQTPEQQRLEVELLLKQAVLAKADLNAEGGDRWSWHPQLDQESCRNLGCLPVQQANDTLVVAVPSHWSAQQRQALKDATPEGPPLALRLALQGDLQGVLDQSPTVDPAPESPAPPKAETPYPETPKRVSLFEDLKLEERLEEAPDDSLRELDVEASLQASNCLLYTSDAADE